MNKHDRYPTEDGRPYPGPSSSLTVNPAQDDPKTCPKCGARVSRPAEACPRCAKKERDAAADLGGEG